MIYTEGEALAERCRLNACSLPEPEPETAPSYGELSEFTEPIRQRRVMAVTDDYVILFDELEGEREHQFDSLLQIKGFTGIRAEKLEPIQHTNQWTDNPLSDAQFITDCLSRAIAVMSAALGKFLTGHA